MMMTKMARCALVLAVASLMLAGCGRKGDLDRPGETSANRKTQTGEKAAQQPVEDRPFLLDRLL